MTQSIIDAAVAHGMDVFRTVYEDENQHLDDAIRVGMLVAVAKAIHDLEAEE